MKSPRLRIAPLARPYLTSRHATSLLHISTGLAGYGAGATSRSDCHSMADACWASTIVMATGYGRHAYFHRYFGGHDFSGKPIAARVSDDHRAGRGLLFNRCPLRGASSHRLDSTGARRVLVRRPPVRSPHLRTAQTVTKERSGRIRVISCTTTNASQEWPWLRP